MTLVGPNQTEPESPSFQPNHAYHRPSSCTLPRHCKCHRRKKINIEPHTHEWTMKENLSFNSRKPKFLPALSFLAQSSLSSDIRPRFATLDRSLFHGAKAADSSERAQSFFPLSIIKFSSRCIRGKNSAALKSPRPPPLASPASILRLSRT